MAGQAKQHNINLQSYMGSNLILRMLPRSINLDLLMEIFLLREHRLTITDGLRLDVFCFAAALGVQYFEKVRGLTAEQVNEAD